MPPKKSVTISNVSVLGETHAKDNYNRSPPAGYNPEAAKAVVAYQKQQSPLPGYSRNAQLRHAVAYQQVLEGMGDLSINPKGGGRRAPNYKRTMNKLMKTRVRRYKARMPTIRENNEANMNYENNFEVNTEEEYANNFHPETEAEEYAALKEIMAKPLAAVEPLAPIPNGRITPAPMRPIAGTAVAVGPSGGSVGFKPSAFGAFKKRGGGGKRKNLRTRRRK